MFLPQGGTRMLLVQLLLAFRVNAMCNRPILIPLLAQSWILRKGGVSSS